MSLTITVTEEIEVECGECGGTLLCRTEHNGRHIVTPCETCRKDVWDDGYQSGRDESE